MIYQSVCPFHYNDGGIKYDQTRWWVGV